MAEIEPTEAKAAYAALHDAIERIVRLDGDPELVVEEDVTRGDPPEQRMVMEYAVIAAVKSPVLIEMEGTQYYTIYRDDQGRHLPYHHAEGLLHRGLDT